MSCCSKYGKSVGIVHKYKLNIVRPGNSHMDKSMMQTLNASAPDIHIIYMQKYYYFTINFNAI